MNFTAILLTAACLGASATGHSQRVTIDVKNAPIQKVFKEVIKQTGVSIIYDVVMFKDAKPVTIKTNNATAEEVISKCLEGLPYTYFFESGSIVIKKKLSATVDPPSTESLALRNEPPLISIRVLDSTGVPLSGASVSVKNSKISGMTDTGGFFTLNANEGDVIIVTFIGYEPRQVIVTASMFSSTNTLIIALSPSIAKLEEVKVEVNTGYQQISKERFVGAVGTLDSAAFHRRAGMDIISRLDGTVTGVLFDKKSGSGDQLLNTQIRGVSTLSDANKQPLVIVDNFPFRQSLDAINPNDVESITVLKDAAASSIWGAQAGNGVIVITTKKGKYNQPVHLSVGSNVTIREKPDLYYYQQIATSDIVDIEQELFRKGRYDGDLSNQSTWPVISPVVEVLALRRAGMISAEDSASQIDAYKQLDVRRDLDKYVYRPAVAQQHYINVAGGTNLFNYSFSGGYNHNLNNIQHSKPDDQFTIATNAGFRPLKKLEITSGINYSQGTSRSVNFSLPKQIFPYSQLADAEGNSLAIAEGKRLGYVDTAGGGELLDWRYRPLDEIRLADLKEVNRFIGLNMGISFRFASWLNATATYQYTSQTISSNQFRSSKSYYVRDLINQFTNLSQTNTDLRHPIPVGSILDISNYESNSQNARGQLNFNKTFGSKHLVTSIVAAEISETKSSGEQSRLYGYNKETGSYKNTINYVSYFPTYGGLAGNQQIPNLNKVLPEETARYVSFLGNVSYTYDGRYSLYASARKDGSNFFGVNANRKWKPLWSTGFSWDISKENFYHINWLSSLRLRASYGFSGNPGNVTGLPTITYNSLVDQLTGLTTAQLNNPPNPDLKWENVRIINTALDFSLFNNRISGSIDVYHKRVTDLISAVDLAPSTGVLNIITNVAGLKGNGFELNLTSKNINGAFSWQTNFGLSHARMVVAKIVYAGSTYNKAQEFVNYSINAASGRMVYGLASYKWAGLDPATGDPRGYLGKQVSTDYRAIFNDSVDQQVFHGSSIPLYAGFVTNTFNWKRFTLSANITYRLNFYFRKPTNNYSELVQSLTGYADYYNRWQKPGDERFTNVPSFVYPVNTDREVFYHYSEVNVLRGDNIRLQDIRLQYSWGNRKMPAFPIKRANLFIYVNNLNLILWRKNSSDLDPDFVSGETRIVPTSKSWTAGLSLDL